MIERKKIQDIVQSYDEDDITIGVLGGHSGLDVSRGAKKTRVQNTCGLSEGTRKNVYKILQDER